MTIPEPPLDARRRLRLLLGSSLLFLSVAILILGALVWYYAEWGLGQVGKSPAYDDGRPLETWDFLGGVFLACLVAPFLGLGFDPLLQHLAFARDVPLSPPVTAAVAVPFWYLSFLPTYALLFEPVDARTRLVLLVTPLLAALLTGAIHTLMVRFAGTGRSRSAGTDGPPTGPTSSS